MTESDDGALVQQTIAGNLKAFERLIDRYQKPVFNLALRMTRDQDEAEDVTQNAFLKAYENLRSYDQRYKFFSWLYRIAMNESLSALRQRRHLVRAEEAGQLPAEPDDSAEAQETQGEIHKALKALTDDQRAVVVLKHIEGFSYFEIARMLSITEKKVKSRLFSARQIMRFTLSKNGMGEG